ncbi:MAG: CRISPR-associated endonuclease Cas1 [Nostoc sp.]|uniref:CRISPR-associated endonuclease Cas1 n=1 Tax=Nostoc sp. TaxID=1180 RepID=UPI002FEF5B45
MGIHSSNLIDSLVAYLINSKIFTSEDFTPPDEKGGVYVQPHALKKFLKHWEEKLQSEVRHPLQDIKSAFAVVWNYRSGNILLL